ncbi:MAG: septation protein SepH [Micrococcus sp.]|nr:septation protein SepH [Micrococcus sp.]
MSVAQEPAAAPSAPREPLSPKEIQARIRAGATAEEVAESTGTSLARVRTFEYPVVAERAWVAQTARATEIWVGGPDLYSDIVDDGGPSTLEEIVGHRLQQLGGDADAISWDAWKEAHGGWTVTAVFDAGLLHTLPTRDTPPARWSYRPGARSVDHANRWARLLSDAQDWEVRPAAQEEADAAVFDVEEEDTGAAEDAPVETSPAHVDAAQADEAEGEVAEPTALPRRAAREDQRRENDGDDQEQQDQLLDILRARRGQRLGADEDSDDTLALLLTREHEPASGTEDRRAADAESASTEYLWDDDADSSDAAVYRFPTATEPSPQSAQPADSANEDANSNADDADKAAPTSPRPAKSRAKSTGKRSSVPSWDEIIFGRKND